jgi:hypothetical protein
MAPSNAIAMPSGNTAWSFSRLKVGKVGVGSELGIAPNRECTVATSSGKTAHTIAAIETAIRNDGQLGRRRRSATIKTTDMIAIPIVGK